MVNASDMGVNFEDLRTAVDWSIKQLAAIKPRELISDTTIFAEWK